MKLILKHFFAYSLLFVCVVGSVFLYYYYVLDGRLINPVIVYFDGVDKDFLEVEGGPFCPGDVPQLKTGFCKERNAVATTQYFLVNGVYKPLPVIDQVQLPIGCYPDNGVDLLTFEPPAIPLHTQPGWYRYVGTSNQTIDGFRKRELHFGSEWFEVVECTI